MGIGKNIGNIITQKNMSIKGTARKAGISYNTLYAIINRDNDTVKPEILKKLSKALEVPPTALMGRSLIFDDTPVDCEINNILKKAEDGEVLTPEESAQLRIHVQQGLQQAMLSLKELSDSTSKCIVDAIPLSIEYGRRILDNSKESLLLSYYDALNSAGKTEAIKRMEELTHIPSYTKPSTNDPTTNE